VIYERRLRVFKTALAYAEALVFVVAVSVPVHYVARLDWPWAIVVGAAASIALRWLIHSRKATRPERPRTSGGH
jgi:hypothetical protein